MQNMSNDIEQAAENIPQADVPSSPRPPQSPDSNLLDDLTKVWGGAVGIDVQAAKAIILTVAGGVAGNSVRIIAPRIGEFGADLQLVVNRDNAPALRRGMQRLLESFEGSIVSMLRQFGHLSSKRAQQQELALLESELHLVMKEARKLNEIVGDERAMINLTVGREAEQTIRRMQNASRQVAELQERVNALRFTMRSMVMVQELGFVEMCEVAAHAYDNAILEVVASPGYLARLAMMHERQLERLAAFRRNSGWASRLEFANGQYRRRAAISTVLLADGDELMEAWSDRMLNATGLLDEMLVCQPGQPPACNPSIADPGARWRNTVHRLFSNRIKTDLTQFTFSPDAAKRLEKTRRELLKLGENYQGRLAVMWKETGPALVAKLSLCARLMREAEGNVVDVQDLNVAIPLATHLLEGTALQWQKVNAVQAERREARSRQAAAKLESENPVARMVNKLRRIGPCTMRTLFRNYPSARYDVLQPVLDRAIELGLVEEEGKMLKAAGVSVDSLRSIAVG